MPRQARAVYPGVPHHVTHRGNNRQPIFLDTADYQLYLRLFAARRVSLRILAYCLMPNHVHWIVIPASPSALSQTFRHAHGQYAQRFNRMHHRSGHLWEGRFYSAPLGSHQLRNALAYVERNPLRASLVSAPQLWPWSSAQAHLTANDPLHLLDPDLTQLLGGPSSWPTLLHHDEGESFRTSLRRATFLNTPLL